MTTMKATRIALMGTTASALLAGGLFIGLIGSSAIAATLQDTATIDDEVVPTSDVQYATNDSGQTYGSAYGAAFDALPDLVSVITNEGKVGYVPRDELFLPPMTLEEALKHTTPPVERVISVSEADGKTVIGTFTVK